MNKEIKNIKNEEGFTLVELLVVIIIIGILAAIAIPVFLNQRKKANDSAVQADVKNVATQIETSLVDDPNADSIIGTSAAGVLDVTVGTGSTGDIFLSDGVAVEVGNADLSAAGDSNGYFIYGGHENGDKYTLAADGSVDETLALEYDSANGGLQN